MFKEVVFIALLVIVAWILIFQIAVPFFQGTPFFPFFRSKKIRALEGEIAGAAQDLQAEELKGVLKQMKPKVDEQLPQPIPTVAELQETKKDG